MSCEKLNCENCVKTNNHCCLADIPYDILTVLDLKNKANKLGIKTVVVPFPKKENLFCLVSQDDYDSGITNVSEMNCAFFGKDGKCTIYDERPLVCRSYGTSIMPCRYTGEWSEEQIGKLNREEVIALDNATNVDVIWQRLLDGEYIDENFKLERIELEDEND